MERLTMTSPQGGVAFTFDLDVTCSKSEMMKIYELAKKLKSYEDKQEQGLLIEKAELDKYKLALFGVIRNSKVMPVGIQQGRSMEEINAMSLKTLEEVMEMCNFDALKQMYEDAEEALAKMGG